jgi:hypothetical protein
MNEYDRDISVTKCKYTEKTRWNLCSSSYIGTDYRNQFFKIIRRLRKSSFLKKGYCEGTVVKVLKTCVGTEVSQGKSSDRLCCGVSSLYYFINCNFPGCIVDLPQIVELVQHTFYLRHISYAKIEIPIKIYRAGKVPIRDEIFCKLSGK